MGLSTFHAQRLFTRWAGVSPKRFLGLLTLEHAKTLLRSTESVMGAAYEVGLSGPSRLHDLFVTCEAMTPGEYKMLGADLRMRWGVHETPFGPALCWQRPSAGSPGWHSSTVGGWTRCWRRRGRTGR